MRHSERHPLCMPQLQSSAPQILTAFAQTSTSGVKFDRSAFGRGFALGVPRFQRGPAARTAVQPVFGLVPSHPSDSELPHHKQLRLSLGAAATVPTTPTGSAANPDVLSSPASAAADAQRAAPADTATEAAGGDAQDGGASSSSGDDSAGGDSDGGGGDDSDDAASDGAMRDLDEDFIQIGPSPAEERERLASEAASAAADKARDTTGLGYTPPVAAAEPRRTWETWEHPWYDANQHIRSQSLRLHNEIVELTTLLKSTGEEDKQRRDAVASVEAVRTPTPNCPYP